MHMRTQLRARDLGAPTVNVRGHSVLPTTKLGGRVHTNRPRIAYCPLPPAPTPPWAFPPFMWLGDNSDLGCCAIVGPTLLLFPRQSRDTRGRSQAVWSSRGGRPRWCSCPLSSNISRRRPAASSLWRRGAATNAPAETIMIKVSISVAERRSFPPLVDEHDERPNRQAREHGNEQRETQRPPSERAFSKAPAEKKAYATGAR